MDNNVPPAKDAVLLVEDDDLLAMSLTDRLVDEGYEVFRGKTAEEGLKIAQEQRPSIIVTDITLPGMDGLSMIKKIHENEGGSKTPVVILTNNNDMSMIAEAIPKETSLYILKADHTLGGIVSMVKNQLQKNRDQHLP
jgi:DNA-binding response OmpR family regulator